MRVSAFHHIGATLVLAATALCPLVATADETTCLGGMRKALVDGHFSGPLICLEDDAQVTFAGLTAGPTKYAIYDYRYRFLPANGQVMHGGQRLLVFNGNEYVGQYSMSPPSDTAVTVRGSYVVLSKKGAATVTVDFSKGPPSSIHFDGETEQFYR